MGIESAADHAIFDDPDEFGATATIGGSPVNGQFDKEYYADDVGGVSVTSSQPMFEAPTVDVSSVSEGDTITLAGVGYTVREIHPDGQTVGRTVLILHLA